MAGNLATRDQDLGAGDRIKLDGGDNPAIPAPPYGSYTYRLVHHHDGPPQPRQPGGYRWYAVPERWVDYPRDYGGHKRTVYLGRPAFELGTNQTARLHIEVPNTYDIVCEQLDAHGELVGTTHYRQVVLTPEAAKRAGGSVSGSPPPTRHSRRSRRAPPSGCGRATPRRRPASPVTSPCSPVLPPTDPATGCCST